MSRRVLACQVLAWLAGWSGVCHANQICPPGIPPSAPDERFAVSEPGPTGEAVVRDQATGLMWKQCSEGMSGSGCDQGSIALINWPQALAAAAESDFAGFTDWRLPTTIELRSLAEPACHNPAINLTRFPATPTRLYWTSTTITNSPVHAWATNFAGGDTATGGDKMASLLAARLVRDGTGFEDFDAASDYTPDPFTFAAQAGVPPNSLRVSEAIVVQGIDTVTGIKVEGLASAAFSVNGGAFATIPGAVRTGDSVRVQHRAAVGLGAAMTTTLTIGGVSADFVTTTTGQDVLFRNGFEP